jgi:putative addiction module killer protein
MVEGGEIDVRQTATFAKWLSSLRDKTAAARIARRLVRIQSGLPGDAKVVGGGISELRIDHGPGYRVYFCRRGPVLIILLCGGDKNTQQRDISTAKAMAVELET